MPPQPLSMACCFVSGGTRAWPMVGLGDGRVVAMEASPAFGADGRSLTLVVGLVATFHVDEVPLQLSSMTVSAQVASEVRRRDPAWCGMRLCLTVRRRVCVCVCVAVAVVVVVVVVVVCVSSAGAGRSLRHDIAGSDGDGVSPPCATHSPVTVPVAWWLNRPAERWL